MMSRTRNIDWVLIAAIGIFACASLIALKSFNAHFFWSQLVWFILGFFVIGIGSQINWRWLSYQPWFRHGFYWLSVAHLVIANVQRTTIRGSKGWIVFGDFQFQPAEFAKLALILTLAVFFSRRHVAAWHGKNILLSCMYMAIPTVLIVIHPDLGSAVVMGALWLSFLLLSGVNKKRLAIGCLIAAVAAMLLWSFVLAPYQKDRILGFVFTERDPLGINYNIVQSKIAIGSAGWFGKGFGAGTQTQLHFLPEAQSDFLFAAFIEEWGIVGGMALLTTFIVLIYRLVAAGLRARDNYARFVVLGTGCFFIVHFFINVGSNVGLMPVTGITFPFFSYGGSNVLTSAALIGIIQRITLESQ